jgi:hypothetical protein
MYLYKNIVKFLYINMYGYYVRSKMWFQNVLPSNIYLVDLFTNKIKTFSEPDFLIVFYSTRGAVVIVW